MAEVVIKEVSMLRIIKIKVICVIMAFIFLNMSIVPQDLFGIPVKSREVQSESRIQDIDKIVSVFKHDIAKRRLLSLRITEGDLRARLARLPDSEIGRIAKNADIINAGGDAGGVIIAVVFIVLIIVSILYFTDYAIKVEPKHK